MESQNMVIRPDHYRPIQLPAKGLADNVAYHHSPSTHNRPSSRPHPPTPHSHPQHNIDTHTLANNHQRRTPNWSRARPNQSAGDAANGRPGGPRRRHRLPRGRRHRVAGHVRRGQDQFRRRRRRRQDDIDHFTTDHDHTTATATVRPAPLHGCRDRPPILAIIRRI